MTITLESPQLKHEADRDYAMECVCDLEGLVPRDERIESQPERLYRPAPFLKKTASPAEYQELADIFHEIWEVNEEYGERQRGNCISICSSSGGMFRLPKGSCPGANTISRSDGINITHGTWTSLR